MPTSMAEKHLMKFSISLAVRKMQAKTNLKFHITQVRMGKINKAKTIHADKDEGKEEPLFIAGRTANWEGHCESQCGSLKYHSGNTCYDK